MQRLAKIRSGHSASGPGVAAGAREEQKGTPPDTEDATSAEKPRFVTAPNQSAFSQSSPLAGSGALPEGAFSDPVSGDSGKDPLASPAFSVNRRSPVVVRRDSDLRGQARPSQFSLHPQLQMLRPLQDASVSPAGGGRGAVPRPSAPERGLGWLELRQQAEAPLQRGSLKHPRSGESPTGSSAGEYQRFKQLQRAAQEQLQAELLQRFKRDTAIEWRLEEEESHFAEVSSQLKLGFKVGEGGFAAVHEGFDKVLQRPVCAKLFDKRRLLRSEQRARLLEREVQLWAALPAHPNVCEFFRLVQDRRQVCLVMEFCGARSLERLLAARGLPFSEPEARGLLALMQLQHAASRYILLH